MPCRPLAKILKSQRCSHFGNTLISELTFENFCVCRGNPWETIATLIQLCTNERCRGSKENEKHNTSPKRLTFFCERRQCLKHWVQCAITFNIYVYIYVFFDITFIQQRADIWELYVCICICACWHVHQTLLRQCITSHIWMRHMTHMNASHDTYECVTSHTCTPDAAKALMQFANGVLEKDESRQPSEGLVDHLFVGSLCRCILPKEPCKENI